MASSKRESDIDIQVSSDEEDDHPVGASTPNVDMIPVHVEVELHPQSVAEHDAVKKRVIDVLRDKATFVNGPVEFRHDKPLASHCLSIHVCDVDPSRVGPGGVSFWQADLRIHVFTVCEEGATEETTDDSAEAVTACHQWVLPAVEFRGLWDSLVCDEDIKTGLLEYATTAMLFADAKVDMNIVSCNRVVLLHGPPGTGKTSLCKALAQKLAIRFDDRYTGAALLEINAHSLFSKWFSESGKLVMKLFAHITDLVESPDYFVCVLIDEVESLTAARKAAVAGTEPSDAVRVVNALLTQLDKLRTFPNVLVLTTSNITEAIDIAFVDRADIKQFIGLPGVRARYDILRSCVEELMRAGIVKPRVDLPDSPVEGIVAASSRSEEASAGAGAGAGAGAEPKEGTTMNLKRLTEAGNPGELLTKAALAAEGLSGRALRKLPFQAHAYFVQAPSANPTKFMKALLRGVKREQMMRTELTSG